MMHSIFPAIRAVLQQFGLTHSPPYEGGDKRGGYRFFLKREGSSHSLWCNPKTGHMEAIPRHNEIPNMLVKKIVKSLSLPEI